MPTNHEIRSLTWETIKLAVMIPWGLDMIWRRTWETYDQLEKPPQCKLFFGTGRTPARRHEIGCELTLEWGASHILILGGDQVYPEADMIRRLVKWLEYSDLDGWLKRKKVVNALVPIRGHQPGQGTRPFQTIGMRLHPDCNEMVPITRDDAPIVKCELIGTGVMLFEADVLNSLKKPWFDDKNQKGTNDTKVMQDVAFMQRLNESGAQVWVDTQIIVKHLCVLESDDSFVWRFE